MTETTTLNPREFVLKKFPNAHVYDSGEWVYVLAGRELVEKLKNIVVNAGM